jgi:DNA-binding transcriptional LysR family regulator
MEWRTIKFDWNRARAFLVTAQEGSLSAAARALGMSQPTLGRQVSALEEELGVALFERVGRRLELTPGGLELVEHVRAMGDAASRVSLAASGQAQSIDGSVCITASEAFSVHVLPPIVRRIRRDYPRITIEIVASNSTSDLRRREADIAVRNVPPADPELIAKRLRNQSAELYATEDYLARIGGLRTVEDMARADFIGFDDNDVFLAGLNERGCKLSPSNFPVRTANHLVHWELAKQGVGIGVMATQIGDAEPLVVRAAPWLGGFDFPIWLVAHRDVRTSRRVRLIFDRLVEEIARL